MQINIDEMWVKIVLHPDYVNGKMNSKVPCIVYWRTSGIDWVFYPDGIAGRGDNYTPTKSMKSLVRAAISVYNATRE